MLDKPGHPALISFLHLDKCLSQVLLSEIQFRLFQLAHGEMIEVHLDDFCLLHLLKTLGERHGDQHCGRCSLELGNWTEVIAYETCLKVRT